MMTVINEIIRPEIVNERILPIIKAVYDGKNEMANGDSEVININDSDFPVFEELATGIAVFYVIDQGDSFGFIQKSQIIDDAHLQEIKDLAYKNLIMQIGENITIEVLHEEAQLYMALAGGEIEASILLIDDFWDQIEAKLNSSVCITIPNRELLYFTLNDNVGSENLKKAVDMTISDPDFEGFITRNVYYRENNKWLLKE